MLNVANCPYEIIDLDPVLVWRRLEDSGHYLDIWFWSLLKREEEQRCFSETHLNALALIWLLGTSRFVTAVLFASPQRAKWIEKTASPTFNETANSGLYVPSSIHSSIHP